MLHFFQYFIVSLSEKNVLTGVEDKQTVSSFIFEKIKAVLGSKRLKITHD